MSCLHKNKHVTFKKYHLSLIEQTVYKFTVIMTHRIDSVLIIVACRRRAFAGNTLNSVHIVSGIAKDPMSPRVLALQN